MQNTTMFPYRRPGFKKRPKSGRPKGGNGGGGGGGGRRPANSPRDLLPLMAPAVKALAHMLAGRTRSSGQVKQATLVREQAERFVAERMVERLGPAEREEFLEQFARLKLILADAESEAEAEAAARAEPPPPAAPPVGQERLRQIALALATPSAVPAAVPAPEAEAEDEAPAEVAVDEASPPARRVKMAASRRSGDRSERLTIAPKNEAEASRPAPGGHAAPAVPSPTRARSSE